MLKGSITKDICGARIVFAMIRFVKCKTVYISIANKNIINFLLASCFIIRNTLEN